jgi:hypothetical protein
MLRSILTSPVHPIGNFINPEAALSLASTVSAVPLLGFVHAFLDCSAMRATTKPPGYFL